MEFRIPEKMRLYKIPAETICKLRDFTFKRSLNGKQTYGTLKEQNYICKQKILQFV